VAGVDAVLAAAGLTIDAVMARRGRSRPSVPRPIALSGKIWERLGVADVLVDLLKDLVFEFAVECAVVVAFGSRLEAWMKDCDIPGAAGFDLHHFWRAMARLGERMEEKNEKTLAPLASSMRSRRGCSTSGAIPLPIFPP
jgi:hypothetical protein